MPTEKPSLVRENRLYQADWLIRFYGFRADELTDDTKHLPLDLDPKTSWALRHRAFFPVDVNRADKESLLRIPGIGVRNVERILQVRRFKKITLDDLRKLRVSIPRTKYFVTTADHNPDAWRIDQPDLESFLKPKKTEQLSLFSFGEAQDSKPVPDVPRHHLESNFGASFNAGLETTSPVLALTGEL